MDCAETVSYFGTLLILTIVAACIISALRVVADECRRR